MSCCKLQNYRLVFFSFFFFFNFTGKQYFLWPAKTRNKKLPQRRHLGRHFAQKNQTYGWLRGPLGIQYLPYRERAGWWDVLGFEAGIYCLGIVSMGVSVASQNCEGDISQNARGCSVLRAWCQSYPSQHLIIIVPWDWVGPCLLPPCSSSCVEQI